MSSAHLPDAAPHRMPVIPERLSVAPMMDRTDRHFRYFMRLMAPGVRLYTEMVTAQAIHHGDPERLLGFHPHEQPVALQLGGSDPRLLAEATRLAVQMGYAEVNLNCGCPSPRVTDGRFGACLMAEPDLVGDCVRAMREAAGAVPVTVKTRIGIDDRDRFEDLLHFVGTLVDAGVEHLIVHARKAWLSGLSPKENREIPPLRYEVVYRLGEAFPQLELAINGGFTTEAAVFEALAQVQAVMIGRAAWDDPWFMARLDDRLAARPEAARGERRRAVLAAYAEYAEQQRAGGVHPRALLRHLHGCFRGEPGARPWRRNLAEAMQQDAPVRGLVGVALAAVERTTDRGPATHDADDSPPPFEPAARIAP